MMDAQSPSSDKPLCVTYFAKDALSNFFGGGPGTSLIADVVGDPNLNIPMPIDGYDYATLTSAANTLANRIAPIVVPGSKALRNIGGLSRLSANQYLAAATKARLKTIGGIVLWGFADLALGQALYHEIQAFNRGDCRAIGY